MMDNGDWKINDKQWLEKRKKYWPFFLKNIMGYYNPDKGTEHEFQKKHSDFYFYGIFEEKESFKVINFFSYHAMHPNLNVCEAKNIVKFCDETGCQTKGYFGGYYSSSGELSDLYEKGVLDVSVSSIIIEAYLWKKLLRIF